MLYSEKVMEHFRNPRNVGEIKDADGIGKVGNPVCVKTGTLVHMNSHLDRIETINTGERVLTHSGTYHMINSKSERGYNGVLLTLTNKLGKVELTPEHLVLAIRVPKGNRFLRTRHRKTLLADWYHAEDLRKGDIAVYPILKETKDMKSIDIDVPKSDWDFKGKPIPDKIPVNEDFLKLCGYFVSEGHPREKPSKTYVEFSLNIGEREIEEDIRRITKNLFGIDVKTKERPERKTRQVFVYNATLTRFFRKLLGAYGCTRKLPHSIMLLPPYKQKAILYGLWKGDGYVNIERKGARAGYSTASFELAQQVKTLLLRQEIVASMYAERAKIKNGVRHKENYRVHVRQRDSLVRLCRILGMTYDPESYGCSGSWFDDDYVYNPLTRIQKRNYSGKVYNFEVDGDHSFSTDAFCLHNCGDLMQIYIKVKKDSDGVERLEDVKFKTFGCGAAIATSSMITELAKGKTLEEAMKITREDVATSLDGLPPIKMHCSNLAADGLRAAIEDYLKKKKAAKKK